MRLVKYLSSYVDASVLGGFWRFCNWIRCWLEYQLLLAVARRTTTLTKELKVVLREEAFGVPLARVEDVRTSRTQTSMLDQAISDTVDLRERRYKAPAPRPTPQIRREDKLEDVFRRHVVSRENRYKTSRKVLISDTEEEP